MREKMFAIGDDFWVETNGGESKCSVGVRASGGLDGAVYGAFASRTAATKAVLVRLAVVAYPA